MSIEQIKLNLKKVISYKKLPIQFVNESITFCPSNELIAALIGMLPNSISKARTKEIEYAKNGIIEHYPVVGQNYKLETAYNLYLEKLLLISIQTKTPVNLEGYYSEIELDNRKEEYFKKLYKTNDLITVECNQDFYSSDNLRCEGKTVKYFFINEHKILIQSSKSYPEALSLIEEISPFIERYGLKIFYDNVKYSTKKLEDLVLNTTNKIELTNLVKRKDVQDLMGLINFTEVDKYIYEIFKDFHKCAISIFAIKGRLPKSVDNYRDAYKRNKKAEAVKKKNDEEKLNREKNLKILEELKTNKEELFEEYNSKLEILNKKEEKIKIKFFSQEELF